MFGFKSPRKRTPRPPENTFEDMAKALKEGRAATDDEWRGLVLNLHMRQVYHEEVCERNGNIMIVMIAIIGVMVISMSPLAQWLWAQFRTLV